MGPTVAAGADPDELYPEGLGDSVAPIMTGAKLPRGTTTIVPVEECQPDTFTDDEVHIPSVPQQQYVRKAGSDSAAGSLLLQAGTRLDALAIAALASQSITTVTVWQRPRVIICTETKEWLQYPMLMARCFTNCAATQALRWLTISELMTTWSGSWRMWRGASISINRMR